MGFPDHAAVLLRRRGRLRGVLAARHQLGRMVDETLHQAVSAGVLLPGILGRSADDAVSGSAPTCLPAGRRRQHSAAVVSRRLCPGAGGDAGDVADHQYRALYRSCGGGVRRDRGRRCRPVALGLGGTFGLSQPRGVADPGHLRCRLSTPVGHRACRAGHRRGVVRCECRSAALGSIRAEPGRHRGPASAQHEPAVAVTGRARNHLERAGHRGGPGYRPMGAASTGVVVDRDRQLRSHDPVPLAHAGAAGCAPPVRRLRTPALSRPAGFPRDQHRAAFPHGRHRRVALRGAAAPGEQPAAGVGRHCTDHLAVAGRCGRRAAVRRRGGDIGGGQVGPQRRRARLRRRDGDRAGGRTGVGGQALSVDRSVHLCLEQAVLLRAAGPVPNDEPAGR